VVWTLRFIGETELLCSHPLRGRVFVQVSVLVQSRPSPWRSSSLGPSWVSGGGRPRHASLAADGSKDPQRDQLYAVWAAFDGTRSRVLVSTSTDKGLKWSEPVPVSDGAGVGAAGTYRRAFMPSVAVNGDGVIVISWYDSRYAAGADPGWDVRFAASRDGGKTWGPSARVPPSSGGTSSARIDELRPGSRPSRPVTHSSRPPSSTKHTSGSLPAPTSPPVALPGCGRGGDVDQPGLLDESTDPCAGGHFSPTG
jgi:hypothetical protein